MLSIGAPVSGPTRPGIINTGTPTVGQLVKRSGGQNCEYTVCTTGEAFDGRIIAVDGAFITVEELQAPGVMELPCLVAEEHTLGYVACASATAKHAKGHASTGTGIIRAYRAIDATYGRILVDSVIT